MIPAAIGSSTMDMVARLNIACCAFISARTRKRRDHSEGNSNYDVCSRGPDSEPGEISSARSIRTFLAFKRNVIKPLFAS
jgi:hypothetical protein